MEGMHLDSSSDPTNPVAHEAESAGVFPGDSGSSLRSTLAALNARTRYRFTGLYRMEPPFLRNVCLHDRENPSLNVSGDIHMLNDTYCAIVLSSGTPFSTDDAGLDSRLEGHAARGRVISYCGIPLRIGETVRGVLCHFDGRPRLTPTGEIEFMGSMESELASFLES